MQVGELFVKLGVDLREYTRGLQQAQEQMKQAGSTLKQAFASAAGVMAGIAGWQGLTAAIRSTIGAGYEFNTQMEQARTAFETFLGSTEKAKTLVEDLRKFADYTPFEFPELQEAAKRMLAFGFSAQDVLPMLKAVGDAAAGLGMSGQEGINRILLALGQMQAKTKVSAEEMLQLTEAGVPAWQILADAMGMSTAEVMKLSEKGLIPANQAIEALVKGMEERFPGMMDKFAKTVPGQLSTLRDAFKSFMGEALEGPYTKLRDEILPGIIARFQEMVKVAQDKGIKEALKIAIPPEAVESIWVVGNAIKDVFNFIRQHGEAVKAVIVGVAVAFATWKTIVTVKAWVDGLKKAIDLWKASTIAQTIATNGLSAALTVAQVKMALLTGGLALVAVGAYELYKHWNVIWPGIKDMAANVAQAVVGIFNAMVAKIAIAWNELKNKLWGLLQGILNALAPVIDLIGRIAPGFEAGFENLRAAVANKIADIQVNLQELNERFDVAVGDIRAAGAGIAETFSGMVAGLRGAREEAEAVQDTRLDVDLTNWKLAGADAGNTLEEAGKKGKKAAEDTRTEWEKTTDVLFPRLKVLQAQYEIASIVLGENASEADKLRLKLDYLNRQYEVQQQIVEHLRATYKEVLATKGEVSKETEEAASKYAQEAKALADLAGQISETQVALQRMSWVTAEVKARLEVLDAEQERALAQIDEQAGKTAELATKLHYLNEKMAVQRELVANLQREYNAVAAAKGKDAEETRKAYLELVKAQTEEAKLQREIRDTNRAIQEQAEGFRKLSDKVADIAKKYRDDLAKATEDYQKKVEEVYRKLAEDEAKLTEQYQSEVDKRAKSLRDFVGLFDEVKLKNVSGEQLLANLRQQVEVFRQWQENLKALTARGVDEGLIAELREMGPKAAAEIAALNTLSDQQLSEYVDLWRQKNEDAKAEAESQLSSLAADTQAKIAELRTNAAAQLEQYRQEWQQKNEEIKQNTINTLKQIVDEASKQGAAMVAALAAAITAAMPELATALAGLPGFAPAGGKDQVAQAQQQKTGVVQAAVEQKQGVTDANLQTVTAVLQMWTDAGAQMAVKQDEIKTKTLTTWQQIQQQLSVLWAKMLADVKKTWEDMRKFLFDVTKQVKDRFTYLVNAANNWGVSLMSNFIAGIWSQFDRLRETLQAMAEMVDSYMPHSPAKRGPLSRIGEWGPSIVRELTEGIRRSLPSLEEVTARMAALSPGALAPAIATSYSTTNAYYGGNTIYIQVSGGGNASDMADQLMRELRKRGVRL